MSQIPNFWRHKTRDLRGGLFLDSKGNCITIFLDRRNLNQDGRDWRMDQELGMNQDGRDWRMDQELGMNQDGRDWRMGQELGMNQDVRDGRMDQDYGQFVAGKTPIL